MLVGSNRSATADNRVFLYEVEGLRQNDQTENNSYPVRNSSTVTYAVPYRQMNAQMQKITRMGGRIVNIRPAGQAAPAPVSEEHGE